MENPVNSKRRQFLKMAALGGGASLLATQNKFALMGSALADTVAHNDYKSLVCVYLQGGNDAFNMLVPVNGEYQTYRSIRQQLAIDKQRLLAAGNSGYGFHPSMPQIQHLYASGQLGVVANTGVLLKPTSLDDYRQSKAIPPELFSHSHQVEMSQTGHPSLTTQINSGWGGLLADHLRSANTNKAGIPPTFSLNGSNAWQRGDITRQFGIDAQGVRGFEYFQRNAWPEWEGSRTSALEKILSMQSDHPLQAKMQQTLVDTGNRIQAVQSALQQSPDLSTSFPENNDLAQQLHMVAKLIAVREQLGMKRQLFYVTANSWDTHSDQLSSHAQLLAELDQAFGGFHKALESLDSQGIASKASVTTFSLSEFGRTLTSNGDGTDHGWASHHLVAGGAVQGGQIHGAMPDMRIGGSQDARDEYENPAGRLIPANSIDQYGATLARWMDIPEHILPSIFPNLGNFQQQDLGFMG